LALTLLDVLFEPLALSVLVCAKAVPNTPITAAAVRLTANFLAFMLSPLVGITEGIPASPVPPAQLRIP
jgi:hypothetical protein